MAFGFNPQTGITTETVEEKLARWQAYYRANINSRFTVVTSPTQTELTPEQALIGLVALEMVNLEGAVSILYDQTSKDTAEGVGLGNFYALLDIFRLPASSSTVVVQVSGTPSADLSNVRVLNDEASEFFRFPQTAFLDANGDGTFTLTAENTGSIQVAQGDLAWTPIPANAGISTITATQDAVVGSEVESDAALKIRAASLLGQFSVATEPAIASSVSAVAGVTSVATNPNRTSLVAADGVPPWHFETIVEGGADQAVADAIDTRMHATMATFGTLAITATSGRIINYTRPTTEDVKMRAFITNTGADVLLSAETRSALESTIEQAFADRVNNDFGIGDDVSPATFADIILDAFSTVGTMEPNDMIVTFTIEAGRLADPYSVNAVGLSKRERPRLLLSNSSVSIT